MFKTIFIYLKKNFEFIINIMSPGPIIILAASFVFLSACSGKTYAPVVNGWQADVSKQGMHTVQPGETLYSIAWRYGLDYREVARANNMVSPYNVMRGQKLMLVAGSAPKTSPPKKGIIAPIKKPTQTLLKQQAQKWIWPIRGSIIKRFSLAASSNKGIDIAAKMGQPVVASRAGEVVYSGDGLAGYGNLIIIKHDDEYLSAYAHNRKNEVKEGTMVTKGQKIAEAGDKAAKRVMLHFEIRYKGKPVNPENYLG